ncbi:putative gustatory receptor 28b [Phlebotomus papatasi]|uniref:Gustatory receptor n=1 Tax=Phlebotomus papatasi TaxID=29031 RepID=A0A240SYF2_PHLPP|nr:putative gustatory receptor 28b [Phlebotomus papatasi]
MDFLAFSEVFFKRFCFFGINPWYRKLGKQTEGKKNVEQGAISPIIVTIMLLVYWCGIIISFFMNHKANDKISAISNIIQLLLNGIALTTVLINVLLRFQLFDDIVMGFHVIDENLKGVGKSLKYSNSVISSRNIVIAFGSYLALSICFDCYVVIIKYEMAPFWYWVVSTLPSVIYSLSMLQSMFIIAWISTRCNKLNALLRFDSQANYLRALPTVQMVTGSMKGRIQKSLDLIKKVYTIMSDICQLSHNVDNFLGPSFLATITAIFAVTSIQVYYIYVTSVTMNVLPESSGFTIWSLLASLNMVIMNIFLIIAITTICDRVNTETIQILQNFSEFQINKEVPAELSIWLHPMISHMKFTAFGFFSIDYTMLCGFVTASVTYLVIFIQFYSIEAEHGTTSIIRNTEKGQAQAFRSIMD